jgi:2-polyprenyl-6-methoxyphenol hydroxylase-like FAD-dependent oxidoreductase
MNRDADVLIVGAGPVGLALAIELGTRGIKTLLAERNLRGGVAPRAKTTNIRTRTLFRRWGIADKLAEASPLGVEYPNDVRYITRLGGLPLAHLQNAFNAAPTRAAEYPEHAQWIPQYTLEKVMLEHAQAIPAVEILFATTFASASQTGDEVVSELTDADGGAIKVTSRYLVGADGARSKIRDLIGAKMEGRYGLMHAYNIIFRAPGLAEANPHGKAVMYWQINSDGMSIIGPMDHGDTWFFGPAAMKEGASLSKEEAAALIAKTTGIDLPYEILSADQWTASELLADRYRAGRIFLAGDACHLHPPFGGYGMNMGVGDGVDLGWKIAAMLQGWGGEALLDSYQAERRQVHSVVIQEAVANLPTMGPPIDLVVLEQDSPEGEALRRMFGAGIVATKTREFHTLGTVLGLGYENSPVITTDLDHEAGVAETPPSQGQAYYPTARPGSLAPHAWMPDGGSLYDLFGEGFTLLVAEGVDKTVTARAQRHARELEIPLKVLRPTGVPMAELYQADLALIRPDQHVAWRGTAWTKAILQRAIGAIETSAADRAA